MENQIVNELKSIIGLVEQLPGGIDEDADPENPSPEDGVAHTGGLIWKYLQALIPQIEDALEEWPELKRLFDLQHTRMVEADKAWQVAHNSPNTLPDLGTLIEWLMVKANEGDRLNALLNTPEIEDFDKAVPLESAHQIERWGAQHDAGKNPEDWFWLVGYLAGKALAAFKTNDLTKAKHHCISASAALRNWHAHIRSGQSEMRPGVSAQKAAIGEIAPNTLEVGNDGKEVIINHPDLQPDENGVGHITFSPEQARNLARLLNKHADELELRSPVGLVTCKARSANMGANDPQDCNWPMCGCDAYADKVIEALQESDIRFVQRVPKIVCLCGSTRFYTHFQEANYQETMAGNIVLSVGFYPRQGAHNESVGCTPEQKKALDELYFHKIELADEILVLNVGGYIGESTRNEINHAAKLGKPIRYLEPSC